MPPRSGVSNRISDNSNAVGEYLRSLLNVIHYFVQCHPRIYHHWRRHQKVVISLFVIFLLIFVLKEWKSLAMGGQRLHETRWQHIASDDDVRWKGYEDESTALRAQLGYLKNKYLDVVGKIPDTNDNYISHKFCIINNYYLSINITSKRAASAQSRACG